MRCKIVIGPDGRMLATVEDKSISYDEARPKIQALLDSMGLAGVDFTFVGAVERHHHGPEQQVAHDVTISH